MWVCHLFNTQHAAASTRRWNKHTDVSQSNALNQTLLSDVTSLMIKWKLRHSRVKARVHQKWMFCLLLLTLILFLTCMTLFETCLTSAGFYCLKATEFVPLHSAVFPWRLRGEGRLRLVWTNKGDLMLVLLTLSLWKSEVQLKKKRRGDDLGASLDFAVTCTNTKTVIYRPLCRRSMSSYILLYMMFCFVSSTKYECPWMAWKQHKLWLVASYDYWAE